MNPHCVASVSVSLEMRHGNEGGVTLVVPEEEVWPLSPLYLSGKACTQVSLKEEGVSLRFTTV